MSFRAPSARPRKWLASALAWLALVSFPAAANWSATPIQKRASFMLALKIALAVAQALLRAAYAGSAVVIARANTAPITGRNLHVVYALMMLVPCFDQALLSI